MRNCCVAPLFLYDEDTFVGIHLPADFTAEHEWGIKDLKSQFGIPEYKKTEPPFGVARYKVTTVPNCVLLQENGSKTALAVIYRPWGEINLLEYSDLKGKLYDKNNSTPSEFKTYDINARGAWDGHSFGIVAEGEKARQLLTKLYEAIKEIDIVVFLGGGMFLQNAGLNIAIASAIPKKLQKSIEKSHKDVADVYKLAEATGIYKKVPKSMYYALVPSMGKNKKLQFLLNPSDQVNHAWGYYTIEQLEQWLVGKGPVLKSNASK